MTDDITETMRHMEEVWKAMCKPSNPPPRVYLNGREIIAGSADARALRTTLEWERACKTVEREFAGPKP